MSNYNELNPFELGQLAGRNLQRRNHRMALQLPDALRTLFSDQEFREAMVIAGVTPEAPIEALYDESGLYRTETHPTSRMRMPSKPATSKSECQVDVDDCQYFLTIPLPKESDSCLNVIATPTRSSAFYEEQENFSQTAPALYDVNGSIQNTSVIPFSDEIEVISTENSQEDGQSEIDTIKSYSENITMYYSEVEEEYEEIQVIENSGTKDFEMQEEQDINKTASNESIHVENPTTSNGCVTCGDIFSPQEEPTDSKIIAQNKIVRELLWIALGMSHNFYEMSGNILPFCSKCKVDVMRMLGICEEVRKLEIEFNQLRKTFTKELVSNFMCPTPSEKKSKSGQTIENVRAGVMEKINKGYENIQPGSKLLDHAYMSIPKNQPYPTRNPFSESITINRTSSDDDIVLKQTSSNQSFVPDENSQPDPKSDLSIPTTAPLNSKQRYGFEKDELKKILTGRAGKIGKDGKLSKEFCCPKCVKIYKLRKSLKTHLERHCYVENPGYQCKICKQRFSTKLELHVHFNVHTGSESFACGVCKQIFASKKSITVHMRVHQTPTYALCTICDSNFEGKDSLSIHMKTHTKERNFICNYCFKSFAKNSNLKDHIQRHLAFKPLECLLCNSRYVRMRSMKAHFRKIHPNQDVTLNFKRYSLAL